MNILVTGAGGFIGTNLVRGLIKDGVNTVYGLCHDKLKYLQYHPDIINLHGDITDYSRMLNIIVSHEIDQIYHLASKSIVRNCRCDPLGCFQANVIGTATVLEAARQSPRVKGVMVAESDKSYGHGTVPYKEDQALCPEGIYEASKACVSHVMTAYHRNYGLPVFSIRSANAYGPGDYNLSRIVPNTIVNILKGKQPQIVDGAANFIRELIYVDDVVDCMIHLMEAKPWGEAINVGSGARISVHNIIKLITELMDTYIRPEMVSRPSTFMEIPEQWLDLNKLRNYYNTFAATSLDEGLRNTINWYKEQINVMRV